MTRKDSIQKENFTYNLAPIAEAVIAIKVNPSDEIRPLMLKEVNEKFKDIYTKQEDLNFSTGEFVFGESLSSSLKSEHVGYMFKNQKEDQIYQLHKDNFIFSKLSPYTRWSEFRDEGKKVWNEYFRLFTPKDFIRVGLRYINKIHIPENKFDLDKYFNFSPQLPESLNDKKLKSYIQKVTLDVDGKGTQANILQTPINSTEKSGVTIVLDIDVYKNNVSSNEDIWDALEEFRIHKNDFFEALITDETRSLFK